MLPKPCMHSGYVRTLEPPQKLYFVDITPLPPALSTPHVYLGTYRTAQPSSQIQLGCGGRRHPAPLDGFIALRLVVSLLPGAAAGPAHGVRIRPGGGRCSALR